MAPNWDHSRPEACVAHCKRNGLERHSATLLSRRSQAKLRQLIRWPPRPPPNRRAFAAAPVRGPRRHACGVVAHSAKAGEGDIVAVHYTGTLDDGAGAEGAPCLR